MVYCIHGRAGYSIPHIPPLGGRGGPASREELICILCTVTRVPLVVVTVCAGNRRQLEKDLGQFQSRIVAHV